MQKLMFFTIGLTAACVVGAYLVSGLWLILLAIVVIVAILSTMALKNDPVKAARLVLAGAVVGLVWFFAFDVFYLAPARDNDTQVLEASVEITDYSYPTDYGIAAEGKIKLKGNTYRVRVYLYENAELSPGDRVTGTLRLRYTAAGGADEVTHHRGKGIFLLGYFKGEAQVYPAQKVPAKYFPAVLRRNITGIIDTVFPEDTVAFARALLLGDSSLLSYEQSTDLSVSGIRHIIAVSGLHVSILYIVLFCSIGYRRVLTPVVIFSMLAVFAALAGFTPSVVRACIMQGLMLLSMVVRKEYDGPTSLSFSVLIMLLVNPLTVTSVSFQLSVGCMIGILAFSEKIHGFLMDGKRLGPAKGKSIKARMTRWFVSSVSVSLSAMIVTIPLSAWYFGAVSLVSVLTNLLTLSVVTVLFCGIMAACVAGALWVPVGKGIAWVISWLARYVLLVSKTVAAFPFAAVYTESVYIVIWLILCYILICVFWLMKGKKLGVLVSCILSSLCVAVGLSWLEPRLDNYRLTVLDVGQGQCILLQTNGKNYLVDCGGDSDTQTADLAAQTLLSQGVYSLDGIILTHYDTDHAGGVTALLSRVPAEKLYLPDSTDNGIIKEEIGRMYSDSICWLNYGDTLSIDEASVSLFAGNESTSDNESGLCVLFQPENCDILITGDRNSAGERVLLRQTELPDLEILVVGHHGSKDATSLELLSATRPEIAIISVSSENDYGHPSAEVLERLELFGCQILRTDQTGNVIIKG